MTTKRTTKKSQTKENKRKGTGSIFNYLRVQRFHTPLRTLFSLCSANKVAKVFKAGHLIYTCLVGYIANRKGEYEIINLFCRGLSKSKRASHSRIDKIGVIFNQLFGLVGG